MPPAKSTIAGLLLIGGKSRRMGRDKAVLDIGGTPLWQIAIEILKPLSDKVIVVGQIPALPNTAPYTSLADSPPGFGPMGGLATGLERSGYEHHLVLAVDYPLVRPALLRLFLEHAADAAAVCGRSHDYLEPLVAYYHISCAVVMRQMISEGEMRTHKVFDRVTSHVVTTEEYEAADPERLSQINVNTPEDLDNVRRLYLAHMEK